jgi:hypothetical protein
MCLSVKPRSRRSIITAVPTNTVWNSCAVPGSRFGVASPSVLWNEVPSVTLRDFDL